MSRRRGCIRSSCCPQSSCVRHLGSRIARYKISITSDVSSNGLRAVCSHRSHRSVSRFPPVSLFLHRLSIFPSSRAARPIEEILFFQVSRTMWRLALLEWKLHSSLVPPSCPLEMSPMYFNHSFFETQRRKSTKVERSDSGCQHSRLLPKNRDISSQVGERTFLTYAFTSNQHANFVKPGSPKHDIFVRVL